LYQHFTQHFNEFPITSQYEAIPVFHIFCLYLNIS